MTGEQSYFRGGRVFIFYLRIHYYKGSTLCLNLSQTWFSILQTERTPLRQSPYPAEIKDWQFQTTKAFRFLFMAMRCNTHLVISTAGSIHSSIQLWVAGCSHAAPQSATYILGKQKEINGSALCYDRGHRPQNQVETNTKFRKATFLSAQKDN